MFNSVSDGWFTALGTELVAGRDFDARDGAAAAPDGHRERNARQEILRGPSPLGRTLQVSDNGKLGPTIEVVGVVRDAKYQSLREENQPTAYVPYDQGDWWGTGITVPGPGRRGARGADSGSQGRRGRIEPLDHPPVRYVRGAGVRRRCDGPRLLATLSGFFAALALTLAVIGLYGTVAYGVTRRRAEIGIRLALGAARGRVLRMVLGDAGPTRPARGRRRSCYGDRHHPPAADVPVRPRAARHRTLLVSAAVLLVCARCGQCDPCVAGGVAGSNRDSTRGVKRRLEVSKGSKVSHDFSDLHAETFETFETVSRPLFQGTGLTARSQ